MAKPPLQQPIAGQDGMVERLWMQFFTTLLSLSEPAELRSYVVASVPAAASYLGCMIYVSNESGGAIPAFSDGVNWRRVTDRAIIS